MESEEKTLQFLSQCFLDTLSSSPVPRLHAESFLSAKADAPDFGLALIRLLSEPLVDERALQSAAVYLKNHLKSRWSPSTKPSRDCNYPTPTPILDPEKEQIRSRLVPLMLLSSPRVRSQLCEAVAVVGSYDFPRSWPTLLPELVSSLGQANDYALVNGILGTAKSIFNKFRYEYKSNDLFLELKYCLDTFAKPLLDIFEKTAGLIDHHRHLRTNGAVLEPLFQTQLLCCEIFYSLNFQELPEFFEDHMKEWMTEFMKYLTTDYPVLEVGDGGCHQQGLAAVVDDLRAAVCENITLYMEKNEEEFQGYLAHFTIAVCNLLGKVSGSSIHDRLIITAIKFLTTVSVSVHHSLFDGHDFVRCICHTIVIPNVRLRDEDVELFDMNYVEFIRRDMEGSDVDTRRRIACELLKGIATRYGQQVASAISFEIKELLTTFAANPSVNWKDKDCAIYLAVSLATKKAGVGVNTTISTELVDVEDFFESVIVPEIESQDVDSFPMLKAGCLRFLAMLTNRMSKPVALKLIPAVKRYLGAKSNVVHSYAASCIEKILIVKDEAGRTNYTRTDINPFLAVLISELFGALKFPESEENTYVMRCIMRVVGVGDISREIAVQCVTQLKHVLAEVCKNPKNPHFSHYLFESVAVVVKRGCHRDSSVLTVFEANLFPALQSILSMDVSELLPYALQLLAQLVELNRPPLSPNYMPIFERLLVPETWKMAGENASALVHLLVAFLEKTPLNRQECLSPVLSVFYELMSSAKICGQSFNVFNTVIQNVEYEVIGPHMAHIWTSVFNRLKEKPSAKFVKGFLVFMSRFVIKHGTRKLEETTNDVQTSIFLEIMETFWIPYLKLITGTVEVKLTSVASTKLLCESGILLDASGGKYWGKLVDSIVTLISKPEHERRKLEEDEVHNYHHHLVVVDNNDDSPFPRLCNAGKKEEDDPLKHIKDTKEFFISSLADLSDRLPGRLVQLIGRDVGSANQGALLLLCNTYNRRIL